MRGYCKCLQPVSQASSTDSKSRVESRPNGFAKIARKVHKPGKGFDSLSISNSLMQNTVWHTSRNACKEQEICNQQTWLLQGFLVLLRKDSEWHLNLLEMNPTPLQESLQTWACVVVTIQFFSYHTLLWCHRLSSFPNPTSEILLVFLKTCYLKPGRPLRWGCLPHEGE